MYHSRLMLDVAHPSTRRALKNCHDMHRNIMKAFGHLGSHAPRAHNSVLYSLLNFKGKPALYVISKIEPDWIQVKGVQPYENLPPIFIDKPKANLRVGTKHSFRLFATPTKKVARENKLSARVFLREEGERVLWMERHAERSGFSVDFVREKEQRTVCGVRGEHKINYTGVIYEGVLTVTDENLFWEVYCKGIGAGKSYGLGMLMLKRC